MQVKRGAIFIVIIVLVMLTIAIVWSLGKQAIEQSNTSQDGAQTPIQGLDRDTNESVNSICPDWLCSIDGSRHYTTKVLGADNLSKQLLSNIYERQFTGDGASPLNYDILSGIAIYGDVVLENKFESLTIVPNSISFNGSTSVSGKIRYGQTDTLVSFHVAIITGDNTTRRGYLTIADGFHYLGGFTSLDSITREKKQYIKQSSYKIPALAVAVVDRELALEHISSLGYNIPDITIVFEDYRSPFE